MSHRHVVLTLKLPLGLCVFHLWWKGDDTRSLPGSAGDSEAPCLHLSPRKLSPFRLQMKQLDLFFLSHLGGFFFFPLKYKMKHIHCFFWDLTTSFTQCRQHPLYTLLQERRRKRKRKRKALTLPQTWRGSQSRTMHGNQFGNRAPSSPGEPVKNFPLFCGGGNRA